MLNNIENILIALQKQKEKDIFRIIFHLDDELKNNNKKISDLIIQYSSLEKENLDISVKLKELELSKKIINDQLIKQQQLFFDQYAILQKELFVQADMFNQKDILLREKEETIFSFNETLKEKEIQYKVSLKEKDHRINDLQNHASYLGTIISAKELEIESMKASKFWKIRLVYMSLKWSIRHPLKFLKKHVWNGIPTYSQISWALVHPFAFIKKYTYKVFFLGRVFYLLGEVRFHYQMSGIRPTLKRIINYILTGRGTLVSPRKNTSIQEEKHSSFSNKYFDYMFKQTQKSDLFVPFKIHEPSNSKVKAIAFYLPQFHPIPENNEWWGDGFTEWTNVSKAIPQFDSQHQPILPGELGFYDLRNYEVQKRQIELAKNYGLYGFCYHYYWFSGKRLLERPLQNLLDHPELDFPFCVNWANENWTRRWDGKNEDILIEQKYRDEDPLAFISDVSKLFADKRYIRIEGKPVLLIYRASSIPNLTYIVEIWKTYCRENGIGEIYLILTHALDNVDPRSVGFDAAVEFSPNMFPVTPITDTMNIINKDYQGSIFDYKELISISTNYQVPSYKKFRCVAPSWDNEARKPGKGTSFAYSTPELYKEWLGGVSDFTDSQFPESEKFVFINAWNEWAEGSVLEPTRKYGYSYLENTYQALSKKEQIIPTYTKKILYVSHDANFNGAQFLSLSIIKELKEHFNFDVYCIIKSGGRLEEDFKKYSTVYNLAETYPTKEKTITLIKELKSQGITHAMTSTVVSGDILGFLNDQGIKTLAMIHELPGVIEQFDMKKNASIIAEKADSIIFPSSIVRDGLTQTISLEEKKTKILPQGLLRENIYKNNIQEARILLRDKLGLTKNAKIVLGVGYADKRKGIDLFLEVAEKMKNQHINFVWVGSISSEMQEFVNKKMKFVSNVFFVETTLEISLYYAGADIYLLSSREDPFPSVVLESMSIGVPVIAFAGAGGFVDIITKDTGILVPFEDTNAMVESIKNLLKNTFRKEKLGNASRELIAERFVFKDYVKNLLGLLGIPHKEVSVIIPNYNYEKFLPERINSVLNQSYKPSEIIFLDDNSTDNSVEVATRLLSQTKIPFKIIKNDLNMGCFKQWAKGVIEAKGDLVWIAEADDSCHPVLLETLVQSFVDPEVGLVYCQSLMMDADGVTGDTYLAYLESIPGSADRWRTGYTNSGVNEICQYLCVKNTIVNASAVLMRRDLLLKIKDDIGGGFNQAGDWFTYIKILENSKIVFHPETLNYHRHHDKNIVARLEGVSKEKTHQLISETLAIQNSILSRFPVDRELSKFAFDYTKLICMNNLGKELESFPEYVNDIKIFNDETRYVQKRILFFSTNDGWGGSEIGCVKIAETFALHGWSVSLCVNRNTPRPKIIERIISEGRISLLERKEGDYCDSLETINFVKKFNPNVVFISQGNIFGGISLMRWCKREGFEYVNFIPLATEYHLETLSNRAIVEENGNLLRESKKIFIDNLNAKKVIEKVHDTKYNTFQVVYNYEIPYRQEFLWSDPGINGPFKLIFLGRLECMHKGLDMLLEVLAMEKWKQRPLEVFAYGEGPHEQRIREILKRDGIKNFTLCGFSHDTSQIFSSTHGIIFPSRMEGTPLALIEALLCHRMAIVTPVGGMPEMINDGYNGFIAESVSVTGIDECLERAWQKRGEWKKFGKNAGSQVRNIVSEFPQKSCVEALNNIFLENKIY